jgi:hypothetical protein
MDAEQLKLAIRGFEVIDCSLSGPNAFHILLKGYIELDADFEDLPSPGKRAGEMVVSYFADQPLTAQWR